MNFGRILGGERHGGVAIGPHHLRIWHPSRVVAQVFQEFDHLPIGYAGLNVQTKLHCRSSGL